MGKRGYKAKDPKNPKTHPKKAVPGGPPVGAPSSLTPELMARIRNLIIQGNFIETACNACGIRPKTMRDWLHDAGDAEKDPTGIKKEFSTMLDDATALAEARDLNRLDQLADKGDFRAIAFRMERRFASRWGRREHLSIQANIENKVHVEERRAAVAKVFEDPKLAEAALLLSEAMTPKRVREKKPDHVVDGEVLDEE